MWAPLAPSVAVDTDGRRLPMVRGDGGHWSLEDPALLPGADYALVIDGQEPGLPDPRSAWQPHGVHGPSRLVDQGAFRWTDDGFTPAPLTSAVIYELHVGTFSPEGTFDGVAARLDHLVDLGVTHLELMPVADFPGRCGWGYDGVALFAPRHAYGGPDGLKRLVDACHGRGLAVILDVVYNHLGPSGNYLARFAPYFNDRHTTHWGEAVNLDGPGSAEVRRFLCDNALGWLRDYHVDGLRLDAVHALVDDSAIHFLEQLAVEVEALRQQTGRRLVLIGESDRNDPRLVAPRDHFGFGLDAVWSDDFHHALHVALTGERSGYYADFAGIADVVKAIEDVYVYDGRHSTFRDRVHGRPVGTMDRARFLAYAQNHDQVGNRAQGDRLSQSLDVPRLHVAAAITLLSPCVPLLFQGEEWGTRAPFAYFADHEEQHLQDAIREGRRREFAAFGWKPEDIPDPLAPETFERCVLPWDELGREPHRSLLRFYRELARLRRSLERRGAPATRARGDVERHVLVMERNMLTVVANLGAETATVTLDPKRPRGVLLATAPPRVTHGEVELAPGVVVLGPEGFTS